MTITEKKHTSGAGPALPYDVEQIRADFPILRVQVRGKPLVYLDNGGTAQKPQAVIDGISTYYSNQNSNIHRGVHFLSELATREYEQARVLVKRFLNAGNAREIVFVRGTTEGINLVAATFGRQNIHAGDEIVVSGMEHHSNIVPWQMLCEQTGAILRVIPVTDEGELRLDVFESLLGPRTKMVAVAHMSNALGTINPVKRIVEMAHRAGARVLLDGAQAAPHLPVDVQDLGCDFYVFSGHKLYGPTGIGVLYGKQELLDAMPPYQGGGSMIRSVTFEKTTYADVPERFEAGTPDISGAIGLGTAIDYVNKIGKERIAVHEHELLEYATEQMRQVDGVRLIGTAREKASILSFTLGDIHSHDIGTILDQEGVAIRAGHHCCQPLMARYGVPATARASFAMYNTRGEVDALVRAVRRAAGVFGRKYLQVK